MNEIRPFRVGISGAVIDDLRARLARTRWPEREPVDDWSMGIPLAYVRELAGYWAESYDMRRVADQLNRYEQFMTTIDGVDIHFLRVRSPVAGATPCIMTHGWPGSVVEFVKVIDPLVDPVGHGGEASDALELVIPSLPGHGWSGKPAVTGWTVEKIAQAWIELMDRLGHKRWAAQGGDWGALVSSAIGRLADPEKLIGIHLNWALADPAKLTELGGPTEEEQRYLARLRQAGEAEGGYAIEQATKPQTLGYGLTDSPTGQLAWIVEKFKTWSDCGDDPENSFTKDELLDHVMVYWTCAAAASSARLYWHSLASSVGSFDEVPAPSAYSRFPADNVALSERWARTRYTDLRYYGTPARGGHFAAYEAPAEFVAEVRAGLRALARTPGHQDRQTAAI
ncbi:epoxide hydrolase family protein [Streptacidiphilus sp. EB103A]|uniref:epoxide hydrolase family protein n=1 Tax=Streptacidiphilus sp. EB103A TaxID=3156275 RepID=UPI0035152479